MPNTLLLRTILAVTFAKGSSNPLTNALLRIGIGYGLAIVLAIALRGAVERVAIPVGVPLLVLVDVVLLFGFVLGGLVMLTMSAGRSEQDAYMKLQQMLWLLPLSRNVRWAIHIIAGVIALGMLGIFGALIAVFIVSNASLSGWDTSLLVCSWCSGLASGYGLTLLRRPQKYVLKSVVYVGVVGLSISLLNWVFGHPAHGLSEWAMAVVIVLCMSPVAGYMQSYAHNSTGGSLQETKHVKHALIPLYVPPGSWFVVKIWRNSRTRGAFVFALFLNTVVSLSLVLRHTIVSQPYSMLLFGAILASTFAADIRGVMRRHNPPESLLVSGMRGLVWSEIRAVVALAVIVGLPLLFALHGQTDNSAMFVLFFGCLQLFGATSGLFASTLLVPSAGEGGTQFFTGMLATGFLVAFPKIAHLSDVAYSQQPSYWLLGSVVCIAGIFGIENIRRKTYGRIRIFT